MEIVHPAWTLPTPDDAIVEPQDGTLFQYVYSEEYYDLQGKWTVLQLLRKFRAGYGGTIPCPSLRHAILALGADDIPLTGYRAKKFEHKQKAFRALMSKTTETVDDGDLFATFILLIISNHGPTHNEETIHRDGLLSILNILYSRTREGFSFEYFRPYFVECLFPFTLTSLDDIKSHVRRCRMISFPLPTYEKRIQSYSELVMDYPMQTNVLPHGLAVLNILGYDLCDMMPALIMMHEREERHSFEWDAYLRMMMVKWKADIESHHCRQLQIISDHLLQNSATVDDRDNSLSVASI